MSAAQSEIVAVCISGTSGLPRPTVMEGELRENLGFVGNKHSVGGKREVCLYDQETYDDLRAEGAAVGPGSFGENLVTRGIPFADVQAGDRLKIGSDAEIEITMVRAPCSNLTQIDSRFPESLIGRSGWMATVLRGGTVRPGDGVEWIRRESR